MDSEVSMILPKGIVINTIGIYKEVAGYPVIPIDKVCEYWHVYTTTNKKLQDPTACRLENFWWHVWGSDRRFLSGQALARLYEDISMGPTFVPLRGPPNRWEGDVPPLLLQAIAAAVEAEHPSSQSTVDPTPSARASLKSLSSSASKPPPSHPILKKARGPSSSGPRPTARFLSPHESADEDDKDSDIPSSGSTATMGNEVRVSSASPAKKKTGPTKKFVASSGGAKRRPLLPRRMSSQSSTTSESGSREVGSAGSRNAMIQRAVSPIPEATSNHVTPDSGGSNVSMLQPPPGLSAKAAGKRPAIPRKTAEKKANPKVSGRSPILKSSSPVTATPSTPTPVAVPVAASISAPAPKTSVLTSASSLIDLPHHYGRTSELTRPTGNIVGSPGAAQSFDGPAMMIRSHSNNAYERYKSGQAPTQGLFTGATPASMTNVAAQGTIIDQSGFGSMPPPPSMSSASSLLESRFTPTQPSTSASVPLGRTRSQLTLVLEREKARIGDKTRYKN